MFGCRCKIKQSNIEKKAWENLEEKKSEILSNSRKNIEEQSHHSENDKTGDVVVFTGGSERKCLVKIKAAGQTTC